MKRNLLTLSALALTVLGFLSCDTDNQLPTATYEAKLELPTQDYDYKTAVQKFATEAPILGIMKQGNSINNLSNTFLSSNGRRFMQLVGTNINSDDIKNEVATLGRVLFYDKKLSVNNTISCGSCHLQSKAFSDIGDVSAGFKGSKTTRNSMSIANPMLTNNLFWDSRTKSLQEMVLKPVQNHIEMGMDNMQALTSKLQNSNYYPALFKKAYGTEGVTEEKINTALMQFLASMVTFNSKFDEGNKTKFANFNGMENLGKDLFMSERLSCTKCHTGANFSLGDDISFDNPYGGGGSDSPQGTANVGLDMVYKDNGRGNGKFKIPSLRNVEVTAPYMHDGRFKTLEEVVEHYNNGIKAHPHLDENLKDATGAPRRLNLSSVEKTALIAFLKTLTDTKYTSDVKYSDPFKY